MKKFIAKNFNKITISIFIINVIVISFFNLEKISKILFFIISLIMFFIFYIIHQESFSEINSKVLDIEYIMRNDLNKEISKEEREKIYKDEYNKYFNIKT